MKTLPKRIRPLPAFGRMALTRGQENALDALWSQAVKKLAGNRCEKCGKTDNLESHHVVGRNCKTLRHIVSNGVCLCFNHHYNWAHQNSLDFSLWMIELRGMDWWQNLQIEKLKTKTFKEYSVIKAYLESF